MRYLTFDSSDGADGVIGLDALASTAPAAHAAVLAEVDRVLQWARQHFPHSHGPVEDGGDWDHALQVRIEDGHWHTVALTLSVSPAFAEAFLMAFGSTSDD